MWATGAARRRRPELVLRDGSRVAVIGGGPAGSFFSIFLLDMAQRLGLDLSLEIHEPRDYSRPGPASCNMCGGIISESLVQSLAAEGINLPPTVVERGIDSYVMHMEAGSVRIRTPLAEKRIAAVHRGAGPRGVKDWSWRSFDGYLQELALGRGATLIPSRVEEVTWTDGRPTLRGRDGEARTYDLLVVATGVNSSLPKALAKLNLGYRSPGTTKTYICEMALGGEAIRERFGNSMHVFLLDIPRLEFAALIPKAEHVTMCLLGESIDKELIQTFLASPEVQSCLPSGWSIREDTCHCAPLMNVRPGRHPYADRVVFIGDCGVARLYKDGIGSAYRTAKAAAVTAAFDGISARDFRRRYGPACRAIRTDNTIGRIVFAIAGQQRKRLHDARGILRMAALEQQLPGDRRYMSTVLWDIFTGSAPYREVFLRTLHPRFWGRMVWEILKGVASGSRAMERAA